MRQIEVDDKTYRLVEKLAHQRRMSIPELIIRLLEEKKSSDSLIGLMADESELMDQIESSAMEAREHHSLRTGCE